MKIIPRYSLSLSKNTKKLFFNHFLKRKLIKGNNIHNFENNFAKYIGAKYAISLLSARTGLFLLLKVLNVKKGDEIILTAYNSTVVSDVLSVMNLKPVFIDAEMKTFNVNPSKIEQKITKNTKIIIATHIEGFPCALSQIKKISKKYNLILIEDCAHALGATYKGKKVGCFGDAAIFSFGIGKHLNTFGGGMIVTNDYKIYEAVKYLVQSMDYPNILEIFKIFLKTNISFILTKPMIFSLVIYPMLVLTTFLVPDLVHRIFEETPGAFFISKHMKRLSNFQAIVGLEQLKNIDERINKRREYAKTYNKFLKKVIENQKELKNTSSSYLNYSIIIKKRENIKKKLLWMGIDTQSTWMKNCARYTQSQNSINFNISSFLEKNTLYLPVYESLKQDDIVTISKKLNKLVV